MTVVVDANVILAVLLADERHAAAQAHLAGWLTAGDELHAPGVLPYEVANVFARAVSTGAVEITDVAAMWQDLAAFDLQLHPFDLAHEGPEIAEIAARLRRSHATDSSYVRLAQRLGTTLWTLDGALARNAKDLGLPVTLVA